jgi:arylsulfatase A-like enzyme
LGSPSAAPSASAPAQRASKLPADLNVLLVTVDALRADMPWAGYPRAIAPALTALEKKSVSYTRAYALSSYTSMSVGGMLGGQYPSSMKRDGFFFGTYPKENVMFPERLQQAGVRTVAAQAHRYFAASAGFNQGFDVWEMVPGVRFDAQTDPNVTGPKHLELATKILSDARNTSGRFFAWFHFMDPHDMYMTHAEVASWGNGARDRYDGEVQFTDLQIGKLLEFVWGQPWGARTAIVVSADHGEAFGEHGLYRHGFEIIEELVRVPWFFYVPGVEPRRIEQPRSHIDLAPTVLELLGVDPSSAPVRGKSLVREILGTEAPDQREVIVDLPRTSDNDRRRALVWGNHKVVAYGDDGSFRVFDLDADPHEKSDLRKAQPQVFGSMVARYRTAAKSIPEVKPYACRALKGAPEGRDY